jgi:hypothetical protein
MRHKRNGLLLKAMDKSTAIEMALDLGKSGMVGIQRLKKFLRNTTIQPL